MSGQGDPAAAARALRSVRLAQQDGATWAQLAPLLRVPDGKAAKREVRRLERALRPVAALHAARKGWDRRELADAQVSGGAGSNPAAAGLNADQPTG